MKIDARMDGTPLEQAHWRIKALREALEEISTFPDASARAHAENALGVDDMNAKISNPD